MSAGGMNQGSARSLESGTSSASVVQRSTLQREAMEYDRRQIRRQMAEKLKERGLDPETELFENNEWEDEESVYDDNESFPWKQREAAVQAAAVGGKTEGRMEGFDSLERALQAHQHQIHYGRGREFGWSAQQKKSGSALMQTQHKLNSMRQLTDWTSFRDLTQVTSDKGQMVDPLLNDHVDLVQDAKSTKKRSRNNILMSTLYVLVALGATLGFAFYIETLKIDTYQSYLPQGYTNSGEADTNEEQEGSDSQNGFLEAAQRSVNAARAP